MALSLEKLQRRWESENPPGRRRRERGKRGRGGREKEEGDGEEEGEERKRKGEAAKANIVILLFHLLRVTGGGEKTFRVLIPATFSPSLKDLEKVGE